MVNNKSHLPLYDLKQIQGLVRDRQYKVVNRRARNNLASLGWDTACVQAFVASLYADRPCFVKTKRQMKTAIGEIDVDCYVQSFNEDTLCEDRQDGLEFWIELAIDPDDPAAAIVSIHLSGQP